jgi:hypothetical protein
MQGKYGYKWKITCGQNKKNLGTKITVKVSPFSIY